MSEVDCFKTVVIFTRNCTFGSIQKFLFDWLQPFYLLKINTVSYQFQYDKVRDNDKTSFFYSIIIQGK